MATQPYHGKTAEAYFTVNGGSNWIQFTAVRSWTCTLNVDTADTTAMAATTGRTRIGGIPGGTCSIECVYDDTKFIELDESDNALWVTGAPGTGIGIELLRTSLNADFGYEGVAHCTGVNCDVALDGTPTVTYNFIWVGEVTEVVTQGSI